MIWYDNLAIAEKCNRGRLLHASYDVLARPRDRVHRRDRVRAQRNAITWWTGGSGRVEAGQEGLDRVPARDLVEARNGSSVDLSRSSEYLAP